MFSRKNFKILFTIFVLILTILVGFLIYLAGGDVLLYIILLVPLIILRYIKSMLEMF